MSETKPKPAAYTALLAEAEALREALGRLGKNAMPPHVSVDEWTDISIEGIDEALARFDKFKEGNE